MHFEQLYNDVLKYLPFSITGYQDLEKKLYNFYDKLSKSIFIKQDSNIKFFFCAFPTLADYNEWKLKHVKYFYFKTYIYCKKESVLSYYFHLLRQYSGNDKAYTNSEILANLFAYDIDIKVSLCNYSTPKIIFDKRNALLQINIPKNIFLKEITDNPDWAQEFDDKYDLKNKSSIVNYKDYKKYFEQVDQKNNIDKFVNLKLYNSENLKNIKSKLVSSLNSRYSFMMISKEKKIWLKRFVDSCLSATFLCVYFKCSFEFMLGVAKVEHLMDKDKSVELFRNLGGITVGYDENHDLSSFNRALWNIMSDKITSVVAGDVLSKENDKLNVLKKRALLRKTLVEFRKLEELNGDNILHGISPIDSTFRKKMNRFFNKINRDHPWMKFDRIKSRITAFEKIHNGYMFKYYLVSLSQRNHFPQCNCGDKCKCITHLNSSRKKLVFEPFYNEKGESKFSITNIHLPVIEELFIIFTSNHNDTKAQIIDGPTYTSEKITVKVQYTPGFNINEFLESVTNNSGGTSIFLRQNYDIISAHGDFSIMLDQKPLFNMSELFLKKGDIYQLDEQKVLEMKSQHSHLVKEPLEIVFENKL